MRALRAASGAVALVLAASAAGCFNDRGLAIEVDTSKLTGKDKVKAVDLFVGMPCTKQANADCESLEPAGAFGRLYGTQWQLEVAQHADLSGATSFRLEAKTDTMVPLIVAIAYDAKTGGHVIGTARLTNTPVPTSGAKIMRVSLTDAKGLTPTSDTSAQDRAMTWAPPAQANAPAEDVCLVIEHKENDQAVYDFISPPDDLDCDGLTKDAPADCNPTAYQGSLDASPSPPYCARTEPTMFSASSTQCVLGSPAKTPENCADPLLSGQPAPSSAQAATCREIPEQDCVPQDVCNCASHQFESGCLMDLAQVPRLDCAIPVIGNTDSCDHEFAYDLKPYFPHGCQSGKPTIVTLDDVRATDGGKGALPHDPGVEVSTTDGGCTLHLKWQGAPDPPLPAGGQFFAIRIPTARGNVLLPLHLSPVAANECPPNFCTPTNNANDTMWSCAAAP